MYTIAQLCGNSNVWSTATVALTCTDVMNRIADAYSLKLVVK